MASHFSTKIYHSPIYCVYNVDNIITAQFSRHVYRGDFQSLSNEWTETDWSLVKENNVDTNSQNVTGRILYLVN